MKKKAKPERPIETVIVIRPNCLTVDKAMIILKSYSKLAPRPAINVVNPEINNRTYRDIPNCNIQHKNAPEGGLLKSETC